MSNVAGGVRDACCNLQNDDVQCVSSPWTCVVRAAVVRSIDFRAGVLGKRCARYRKPRHFRILVAGNQG